MSTQFETPGPRGRPAVVSYAAYAQFAVGALAVIATVVGAVQTSTMMSEVRSQLEGADNADPSEVDAFITLMTAGVYVSLIVSLLFAVAVAILGLFNLKGRNGTRITTWVLAGLGLLCGVCGSVGGLAGTFAGGGGAETGDASFDEINQTLERVAADMPGWYDAVSLTSAVLNVLLYLAIIILLALPVSNDYFRKPKSGVDVLLPPEAYMDAPLPPPGPAPAAPVEPKDEPEPPKDEPQSPKS